MRQWMIDLRQAAGMNVQEMAKKCDVSQQLLHYLEEGSRTLPPLAVQIGDGYGMTDAQVTEISKDFEATVPMGGHNGGKLETVRMVLDLTTRAGRKRTQETPTLPTISKGTKARAAIIPRTAMETERMRVAIGADAHYKTVQVAMAHGQPYLDRPRLTGMIYDRGETMGTISRKARRCTMWVSSLMQRCGESSVAWETVDYLCEVLHCSPWEILVVERSV